MNQSKKKFVSEIKSKKKKILTNFISFVSLKR